MTADTASNRGGAEQPGVPMISYAQNGEDVVLERAFREKALGFYIDVRAGDPTDAAAAILERVRALLGRPEGARASNGK